MTIINSNHSIIKIMLKKFGFLFAIVTCSIITCVTSCTFLSPGKATACEPIVLQTPVRPSGQTDVINLTAPKLETVRVGFIGLGMRGPDAVARFTHLEGVQIVALCDIHPERVENCQEILKKAELPEAVGYSGSEDVWKQLCERDDIDLVYIATDWINHTPMSVYAMEKGKHVACEVPIAISIDECWQLVNTAEKTRKHCIMLENCCYDFYEMTTLNMAQQGLLGEVVHAEGAYIHDLRFLNFRELNITDPDRGGYNDYWRLRMNEQHTGNYYPTHGLGPVAQALNLGRGDRMKYLVSLSSDQFGMTAYAKEKFGDDSDYAKQTYALGDMNTTLIKTAKGKSIMIQHDVTSPRPYNRKHALSGTKGYIEKYPRPGIALEPSEKLSAKYDNLGAHGFVKKDVYDALIAEYEHPITKEVGELAKKVGGHGGMDFIMDYRLIYCLHNGLPLDMNVYDGVDWSCLGELTEISVKHNSAPIAVPDFTRGSWDKVQGFKHAFAE
ncbi:Glycosyl hydrolase family 109 protein [termite gut metagenome]|uniref:Glycosyl hydrolase family 109 protein n=1 Tax=termite gut metagenome TaxID=433724 RepID=A0A5J4SV83_9ZZZZ